MRKPTREIQLTSYDDLLGINENEKQTEGKVVEISLSELHPFMHHPFQVVDDEEMEKMAESIREYGVLCPVLVRPRVEGGYEIISGHRRKRACELAGLGKLPVLISNYTDDESTVIMVDSNIQRENILPSEKAFAYRMKMEALKHQGIKGDSFGVTADLVGEKAGDSVRKVHRYIRLTELVPELLHLVDRKKLKVIPAVVLSYLTREEQGWVYQCITEKKGIVSETKARALRKYSEEKALNRLAVELTLCEEKRDSRKLSFSEDWVNKYFPADYSREQMEDVICSLLEEWSKKNKQEE